MVLGPEEDKEAGCGVERSTAVLQRAQARLWPGALTADGRGGLASSKHSVAFFTDLVNVRNTDLCTYKSTHWQAVPIPLSSQPHNR